MLSCIFNHPGKLCSYWPQMTRPSSTIWKTKMLSLSIFILYICIIILEDQMQIFNNDSTIRIYTFNLFISNVYIIIVLYWRLHDMLKVYLTRLFFLALIVWTVYESPIFVETKQRRSLKQQCAYTYIPAEEIFSFRKLYQSLFSPEIVTISITRRKQWNKCAIQCNN